MGLYVYFDGEQFHGEWKGGKRSGLGIQYSSDGRVQQAGEWEGAVLKYAVKLDPAAFPFSSKSDSTQADLRYRLYTLLNRPALSKAPWKERIDSAVRLELQQWLMPQDSNLEEVPPPEYPPALELKQEIWETNEEFEIRVISARKSRSLEIDRIQAEYLKSVEARNLRVRNFNETKISRERNIAIKRRELILLAIKVAPPAVETTDFALDQAAKTLTFSATIEGFVKKSFSIADTSQDFRRTAITSGQSVQATPEFEVSDDGELKVRSIIMTAAGSSVQALPSAGTTSTVSLASVIIPTVTAPVVIPQSTVTVDRNQVEQILYRNENELLRKRLDEQRRLQQDAIAAAEARSAAEISRLKSEADTLRKSAAANPRPSRAAVIQSAHALVIGNSTYPGSSRLENPARDAAAMSLKLRQLGFVVTEVRNVNRNQMISALSKFSETAAFADVTLLFYAGHGVQIGGTNYMIPIDFNMTDGNAVSLEAVSLNTVVEQHLPGKTKLVFLDACRDNPLMASGNRSVSKGLAPITVAEGTLISYATKDGQTAEDGVGQQNSPFTTALLEHLGDPDDIAVILRSVRSKVMQRTNNRQQPWEYGSLTGGALILASLKKERE